MAARADSGSGRTGSGPGGGAWLGARGGGGSLRSWPLVQAPTPVVLSSSSASVAGPPLGLIDTNLTVPEGGRPAPTAHPVGSTTGSWEHGRTRRARRARRHAISRNGP